MFKTITKTIRGHHDTKYTQQTTHTKDMIKNNEQNRESFSNKTRHLTDLKETTLKIIYMNF